MSESDAKFRSDNPLVERLLAGTAPEPIRIAAARGALPITTEELFHVLFAIRDDPDPAVAAALAATIDGLADTTLAGILAGTGLHAGLLDFFARRVPRKKASLAAIVTNRLTADQTLVAVAEAAESDTLELLVTNQVALIRAPQLIDSILANPAVTADQRRRLLEVREEFFVKKELDRKRREEEEARLVRLREKKDWTQQELEKLQDELAAEAAIDKEAGRLTDHEDAPASETDEVYQNATQRIITMSVPEKVLLAIRGSRTERRLLIGDSNRLVATSVIRSPKITDSEIEYYAGLRNVSDEILRYIGGRREWLKSYTVVLTLVKNPRTPLAIAINLLQRLQQADLKKLGSDRNVPETLRRQSKQTLDRMNQKSGAH